ncbi:DoxX family protein [Granulicella tundricola MP5ACTX9]|uniref:DoxX family protein n=2 Tax=Granulicella TaxID=940557 RepID=E8WZQ7_GRATM|nr:DoxX family protein [Granulicella tundricola MP5ACTX9]
MSGFQIGRVILAVVFVVAGVLHFVLTPVYVRIVPGYLPSPVLLVHISGICEVLGGIGLLVPRVSRVAAWGLVALLVAVFPANVTMVLDTGRFPGIPLWAAWVRLPLQLPLIWWAWIYTRA